jgi:predicted RNase H-like nuclease (RuvC/YqgF family)
MYLQAVLREMLGSAKTNNEKLSKEYTQLNEKVTKLQSDLEEQIHQNANLLAENGQKQLSIKSKEDEIAAAKAETTRVTKIQAQTAKKLKGLEESREAAEKLRDTLKTGMFSSVPVCSLPGRVLPMLKLHCAVCVCTRHQHM